MYQKLEIDLQKWKLGFDNYILTLLSQKALYGSNFPPFTMINLLPYCLNPSKLPREPRKCKEEVVTTILPVSGLISGNKKLFK